MCIHKDRYILKHKIISILGFEITDEEIDLIHLSDFARMAMANKNMKENILSVVHEAVVPVSNHNMPSQTFAGDVKAGLV